MDIDYSSANELEVNMSFFQIALSSTPVRSSRPRMTGWLAWLMGKDSAYRQTQALKHLSDDALRDIGITRADADKAAGFKVWDAPIQFRQR